MPLCSVGEARALPREGTVRDIDVVEEDTPLLLEAEHLPVVHRAEPTEAAALVAVHEHRADRHVREPLDLRPQLGPAEASADDREPMPVRTVLLVVCDTVQGILLDADHVERRLERLLDPVAVAPDGPGHGDRGERRPGEHTGRPERVEARDELGKGDADEARHLGRGGGAGELDDLVQRLLRLQPSGV